MPLCPLSLVLFLLPTVPSAPRAQAMGLSLGDPGLELKGTSVH